MRIILRSRTKSIFALLIALFLLSACSEPKQEIHKYSYFTFGTIIQLTIAGVEKELADEAAAELDTKFADMHNDWHAWQPSPVMTLNQQLAKGETATVDEKLLPLLLKAKAFTDISSDTFNPAIGHLLFMWGYQKDEQPIEPPAQLKIDEYLNNIPDLSKLKIDGNQVSSSDNNIQFDLGGFAKGYGIDRAIDHLKSKGITNAIVNAGGDLKVIGQQTDRPWRIGIRHPRKTGSVIGLLDVNDGESVFTSGDYERYFIYEDRRYHHILDPRTGLPATDLTSVTIITEDAALADAAATALFVAGLKDWEKVATQMGINKVMLIDKHGQLYMTAAMQPRMQLVEKDQDIVISRTISDENR